MNETYDPDNDQEYQRIMFPALTKSFLVVAGGAFFVFLMIPLVIGVITWLWFPAAFEKLSTDPTAVEKLATDDLAVAEKSVSKDGVLLDAILQDQETFPIAMWFACIAAISLICFGVGWGVARVMQKAPRHHAFFLAVVMFATSLQSVLANGSLQWPMLVGMFVFPGAVILGSRLVSIPERNE